MLMCDQAVPSQCMISVRTPTRELPQSDRQYQPTAQACPPGPELTLLSSAAPPGFGLRTLDHVVPLQCMISARPGRAEMPHSSQDTPTAQALVADATDTLSSLPAACCAGGMSSTPRATCGDP
jgi:hypothetical protein